MKLKALSLSDCEQARQWRNEQLPMLRTSFPLTQEQQEQFYYDVVCDRKANARYWGIVGDNNKELNRDCNFKIIPSENTELIGMFGLENISWENRNAEISLIFNPEYSMDKYGEEALELLLHEGFMSMNLENIYTEVYFCSQYLDFWFKMIRKYSADAPKIPNRKFYNGQYWSSTYININKGAYANENTVFKPTHTLDAISHGTR